MGKGEMMGRDGLFLFGRLQSMHKYLEYSQQELDLLRRCTQLHKRSLSKNATRTSKTKTIDSDRKPENLEDTRKIAKAVEQRQRLDEQSTKKKKGEPAKKTLIQQVSEFAILQQRSEESSLLTSQNLNIKAGQNKDSAQLTPSKLQKDILQRIDSLKSRLEYRLFVNSRQLMKRPAYGKYITCKFAQE